MTQVPNPKQTLGKRGESLAAQFLTRKGYKIIDRNFHARYGEIDIVCLKDGILVFVEVKTRCGRVFGTPEEAVTPRKLHEIIQTSQYYTLTHPNFPSAQRIDVIAIDINGDNSVGDIRHIENVTL